MPEQTDQDIRAILYGFETDGLACEGPALRVAVDRATGWISMRGAASSEAVRLNEDWFINAEGRPFTLEAIRAELCRLYRLIPTLPEPE